MHIGQKIIQVIILNLKLKSEFMKLKYYKQEQEHTCGAAAMRMVLESLGIKKSENELIPLLKTNTKVGTWHYQMPALAEKYKLNYVVHRNASIKELKEFLKNTYLIIVCYYLVKEKTAHYAVVLDIDDKNIYFNDPWRGPNHKLSLSYFRKNWISDKIYEKEQKWFIGIKKSKHNVLKL
jgi:ABC-type bacteriocin/lantibiotic exporter with double-glycine peptidase domain